MRIDKYLKVSRLIKRRTVASDAVKAGKVMLNGKAAKPASEVKAGDVIELHFGERVTRVEVLSTAEHAAKADAAELYKVLP